MTEIKTDGNASEHPIKIERRAFDALLITRTMWRNLGSPSEIQRPQLILTIHINAFHESR